MRLPFVFVPCEPVACIDDGRALQNRGLRFVDERVHRLRAAVLHAHVHIDKAFHVLANILRPDTFDAIEFLLKRCIQRIDLGKYQMGALQNQAGIPAEIVQRADEIGLANTADTGLQTRNVINSARAQGAVNADMGSATGNKDLCWGHPQIVQPRRGQTHFISDRP